MQSETSPPISHSSSHSGEAHGNACAVVSAPVATWRRLLPAHRIPVIAKTPFLIALGVYMSGGRFDNSAAVWAMFLAGALWAVLYALNESADLMLEQRLTVTLSTRVFLFALCASVCLCAARLAPTFGLLCAAMAIGQIAYCVPPMRLKRYWWAVLLLSGMLNPVLRLACGALWGTHAISPLAYFVFVSLHLGACMRSRVLLRERDEKLAYRIAPPRTEWAGMAATGVGFIGAYGLCWQGVLPRFFVAFTTIAAAFSLYAWSGRVRSVARLREGWLWFAVLAFLAFAVLYLSRT